MPVRQEAHGGRPKGPRSSESFSCVREERKKMIIKNNNGPEPPRTVAPPLAPDGEDHASGRPRRMLNEKQILALIPIARSTLWRMEKQGKFPKGSYILANRKLWYADEVEAWQNALDGQGHGRRNRAAKA
jgi:prophage regulatory protein